MKMDASSNGGEAGNGSLIQIVDMSQMIVTVQINQDDILKVKPNQQAKVTFSALPDVEMMATVQKVSDVAAGYEDASSYGSDLSGGIVTYPVSLLIPAPDPQLKMGMTASVEILTSGDTKYIIVPEDSVLDDDKGGQYVTVLDDNGEMKNIPVKIVKMEGTEVAIEGDVHEGDLVISTGASGGGMPEEEENTDDVLDDEGMGDYDYMSDI
jgi:HlyD family secretion protein